MNERIKELFAFASIDPEDNVEGVIGMRLPDGAWMPLVGADMNRVESLKPFAVMTAAVARRTVRLVRFETRTDVEVIHPDGRVEPV